MKANKGYQCRIFNINNKIKNYKNNSLHNCNRNQTNKDYNKWRNRNYYS